MNLLLHFFRITFSPYQMSCIYVLSPSTLLLRPLSLAFVAFIPKRRFTSDTQRFPSNPFGYLNGNIAGNLELIKYTVYEAKRKTEGLENVKFEKWPVDKACLCLNRPLYKVSRILPAFGQFVELFHWHCVAWPISNKNVQCAVQCVWPHRNTQNHVQ